MSALVGLSPRSNPIILEVPEILELIESQSWTEIIRKLHDEPSDASIRIDSTTGQSNLAIHEACKHQPPVAVIESLIKANPASVMTKGQWGYLPIHFACSTGASNKVVSALITVNPACARSRDEHEQRLPLHIAAKWGAAQDVVLTIMTHHPEGVFIRDAAGKTPMDYAKALPAHRKLEVVKALKQGPLLSAVSKAAMQRASTNDSIRQHRHETEDMVPVAMLESRLKEAEANSEKAYATILSNLEAKYQKQIEQTKLEAESSQKAMEGKFLVLIADAKAESEKERSAFAALELSYEADVAAAKKEAEKHKERLTVSNRKIEELELSGDCLTVSTLPLRQKLKAVRAELEEEWENNRELTKENESLKKFKTEAEVKLDDQAKSIEAMKTDLLAASEKLESNDTTIAELRDDISKKEAHNEELIATVAGLETELTDQETEIDTITHKLHEAKQEIVSRDSTINDLKDDISKKETRAEELVAAIQGLESELVDQEKETEVTKTDLRASAEELESRDSTIADLRNDISKKETHVQELVATIQGLENELVDQEKETEAAEAKYQEARQETESRDSTIAELRTSAAENIQSNVSNIIDLKDELAKKEAQVEEVVSANVNLGIELNDQKKVTETLTTKLHAATQEIDAKERVIADLQLDVTDKESRVIELKQELADAIRAINEKEVAGVDLAEKNQETEELKSRLHIATEEILLKASMISMLDARHMDKESQCEMLTRELEELKPKLESEIERSSTLAQNVSDLTTKKTDLELELKENIIDLEVTKEKIAQVTTELEEKNAKISDLEGAISEQKAICEDLTGQLEELRVEHKNEQHRAGALEEQVQALEKDKTQLQGEVAVKVEDVDRTKSRMYDLVEEIEMKCSKINGLEVLLANEEARCEDLNTKLEEVKTELESAQTQVSSLSENLSNVVAAKESLEANLKEREVKLEETATTLNSTAEERELKIADNLMLEGLLSDKHAEVEDLSAQLKVKQAEAERALVLEQEVDKTSSELASYKARGDELRMQITQLSNQIATANLEIRKYKMRAKTVEKWVSSFALSIQGWRIEQEHQDDIIVTDSASTVIAEIDDN